MTTTPLYETHDLKIQPAKFKGLSWLKSAGRHPVLVTDDRIVDEMESFGVKRLSNLGTALHLFVENMMANPRGTKAPTPGLVFHEWVRCEPEPMTVKQARRLGAYSEDFTDEEIESILAHKYDPETECERTDLRHTKTDKGWGHLVPDAPGEPRVNPMHYAGLTAEQMADPNGFQAYIDTLPPEQKPSAILLDGQHSEVGTPLFEAVKESMENPGIDIPLINREDTVPIPEGYDFGNTFEGQRVALSDAGEVKNLAEGLTKVAGFEEALRDTGLGHKAIGEMFPFTSETSVRRWRKAQGVVLS